MVADRSLVTLTRWPMASKGVVRRLYFQLTWAICLCCPSNFKSTVMAAVGKTILRTATLACFQVRESSQRLSSIYQTSKFRSRQSSSIRMYPRSRLDLRSISKRRISSRSSITFRVPTMTRIIGWKEKGNSDFDLKTMKLNDKIRI